MRKGSRDQAREEVGHSNRNLPEVSKKVGWERQGEKKFKILGMCLRL